MEMEYERIGHLVAISAVQPGYAGIPGLSCKELEVAFADYVKSQVHLNLVTGLYGRTLRQYVNALRYCNDGEAAYLYSALEVLRYFYSDMASFLIKNSNNIKFSVTAGSCLGIPDVYYDYGEIQSGLLAVAENATIDSLRRYQFSWVFDYVNSKEDLKTKIDSYTMAVILLHESKAEELHRVIVKGGYDGNHSE